MLSEEKIEDLYFTELDNRTLSFARAIEAAVLEAQSTDQRLLNLLCRIHRDGGHYIAEHGLDKAVEDADLRVAEQNAMFDELAKQEPVAWMRHEDYKAFAESAYTESATVLSSGYGRAVNGGVPLYRHPAPVPGGMVLVPREPTEAMIDSGWAVEELVTPLRMWRAMIAAAEKEQK